MTLKNNRAPLLSNSKLCASFHHQLWIQTGVTVRKRLSWVLTSVTLNFALWPWPFAWMSLLSLVITSENFMMVRWWEHSQKGVTDRRTYGQTDWTIHKIAWSQLKKQQNTNRVHNSQDIEYIKKFVDTMSANSITHNLAGCELLYLYDLSLCKIGTQCYFWMVSAQSTNLVPHMWAKPGVMAWTSNQAIQNVMECDYFFRS